MNTETFPLTPDPAFIALLCEHFPHQHRITRRLANGNMQDEVLPGTNFMEDVMRVHQDIRRDKYSILWDWYEVDRCMWTQPYIDEVKRFLRVNNIAPDQLANFWLLRCRLYYLLNDAKYDERSKTTYDFDQTKKIDTIKNQVIPFIEALQGDVSNIHSVLFKSNKPAVPTLTLTGHLARNMYTPLQNMADRFLASNKDFAPDLHTKRFKKALRNATLNTYKILRQWQMFSPSTNKTPHTKQLKVLKKLIELALNEEGYFDNKYSKPEEHLRKFFLEKTSPQTA